MNFVEFLSLMHHAMFGNHRPSGSREEKKYRFFLFIAIFLFIGHVTWAIYINFHSPFLRMLHMKFVLIGQVVSEKKMVKYYGNIHVYCPGVGTDQHLGSNFCPFPLSFFLQMTF